MSTDKQEATDIKTTFFHAERTIVVHLKPAQRFFLQLMCQWYAKLVNAFQAEVGVFYSREKRVLPLTVTTYHSAGDQRTAMELITLLQGHAGQSQTAWQQALERYVGDRMDYQVIRDAFGGVATEVLFFPHKPVLKEVMETVEEMAERIYGPRRKHEHMRKKQRPSKRPC